MVHSISLTFLKVVVRDSKELSDTPALPLRLISTGRSAVSLWNSHESVRMFASPPSRLRPQSSHPQRRSSTASVSTRPFLFHIYAITHVNTANETVSAWAIDDKSYILKKNNKSAFYKDSVRQERVRA